MQIVSASHKNDILEKNLLKSKIVSIHSIQIQRGYTNIPKAYNDANTSGITIYVHHDVYLPNDFEDNIERSIKEVEKIDNNWGVIGVAGVKNGNIYGNIIDRGRQWGSPDNLPHEVDTLDELVLITKYPLRFDEKVGNHFYGTDICLQARELGMKSYAVDAKVYHNSGLKFGERPSDFWESRDYIKEKYKHFLPITTTCTKIT